MDNKGQIGPGGKVLDVKEKTRSMRISDGVEVTVVILSFIFAIVFLLRLGEEASNDGQFQVQNATNLLVASVLSVIVLSMFVGKVDRSRSLGHMWGYGLGGGVAGVTAYLLVMYDLAPEVAWVCLVAGLSALAFVTVQAWMSREPGSATFAVGMWTMMVISGAAGLNIIRTSNITGLLMFVALAGIFVGIYGLLDVVDHGRSTIDRFGYSASIYCLLMIWLSTSRVAASGGQEVYSPLDTIMSLSGVVLGMLGASVLTQRRYLDDQIRAAMAEGHDNYKEGEYEKAVESYDRALAKAPGSKAARTCKADALSQLKRYKEAIKIYDSVIIDDKDYTPAISGKGSALRQTGELSKSVIYLQKALNVDPDSKVAWNNKGNAFFFLDQLKTAIFCYKKAIELDPKYSGAWYNLAVSYTNTGQFLEADHAFRTAANLLERKRPLLEVVDRAKDGAGVEDERLIKMLSEMPQEAGLELLSGDMAKRALSHIAFNPGVTRREVMGSLGFGEAEAKAVLAGLSRSRLVETKRDGAKVRYYPKEKLPVMIHVMEMSGGTVEERKVRYLTDLQKRIMEELEREPGLSSKVLSERLGVSSQVIDYHLDTLAKGGVISGRRRGMGRISFSR